MCRLFCSSQATSLHSNPQMCSTIEAFALGAKPSFGDSASQGLASAMFWLMFLVNIAMQTQDGFTRNISQNMAEASP